LQCSGVYALSNSAKYVIFLILVAFFRSRNHKLVVVKSKRLGNPISDFHPQWFGIA